MQNRSARTSGQIWITRLAFHGVVLGWKFHDFRPQSWGFHFKLRDGSRKTVPRPLDAKGVGGVGVVSWCIAETWNISKCLNFTWALRKSLAKVSPLTRWSVSLFGWLSTWFNTPKARKDSAPGVGAFRDHRFGSCTPEPGWRIFGTHFCWKFRGFFSGQVDLEGACEASLACSTCHIILAPDGRVAKWKMSMDTVG